MLLFPTLAAVAVLAAGASDAPDRFAIAGGTLTPTTAASVDTRFAIEASARLRENAAASDRFALKTLAGSLACTGSVGPIFSNGFE